MGTFNDEVLIDTSHASSSGYMSPKEAKRRYMERLRTAGGGRGGGRGGGGSYAHGGHVNASAQRAQARSEP